MWLTRALGVLALACSLLLVAGPAQARRTVVITGGGWGHGIGMSQYGAYGRAKRGDTAEAILTHYYSGTEVATEPMPRYVRVGLADGRGALTASTVQSSGSETTFKVKGDPKVIARGGAGSRWRVEASETGGIRLFLDDEPVRSGGSAVFGDPNHPLVLTYEPFGSIVDVGEKPYNYAYGRLEFASYAAGKCAGGYCLRLVLSIPMQKYLYGLGEVPASWPAPVLESQAIAARTYAFEKHTRTGDHRDPCDCTVYDSTLDQAYVGDAKRTGSDEYWDEWKAAVDATLDEVILHKNEPIQALYSSSSGGHTENNENVWGGTPMPYLRGVQDGADDVDVNPNHTWELSMSYRAFQKKLNAAYSTGKLQAFDLVKPFGVSGRVTVVTPDDAGGARVKGSTQTVRVSGWSLRSALGLKDTLFRVEIHYPVASEFAAAHDSLSSQPGGPGAARSSGYWVPRGSERHNAKAQDFEKGRMTWLASKDAVVWQWGAVLRAYDGYGRERSSLGLPAGNIWGPGRFRGANYNGGLIVWSEATGARSVRGDFATAYRKAGSARGALGLPVSERRSGRQDFEDGNIYLNPDDEAAYALWGPIADRYEELGATTSKCGYPTSSMNTNAEGTKATFQKGTITWTKGDGLRVNCN